MCIHNIPIVPEFHFPMGGHDLWVTQAEVADEGCTGKGRAELSEFPAAPRKNQERYDDLFRVYMVYSIL